MNDLETRKNRSLAETGSSSTRCIHRLFETEVKKGPGRIALVHGSEEITYAELNLRANRVAHRLLSLGLDHEALVGLAMERSPDLIACILGVLKAGGAYLPLDPGYPRERLAMILEEAKPPVVLTRSALAQRIPAVGSQLACIDELEFNEEYSENPDISTAATSLAYVMFTSGSTGRPKGVMVEHRSIIRLVKDTDYADFSAENVFLQFAPITFDASTFEIWGALLNGARLAIMPEGVASLADLGSAIREYGVTTLWLTAGLFHLMIDERIDDLRPLRQLLAGGDVLSVTHVQKALENLDCDLINGYGPTENTTFTCTYKIPRNVDLGKSIPIGKPITGTQVIILDDGLNPVADGEVGELFMGGDGLARGYFNSEEMTAERFIENRFNHISSSKLYRSGDLARVRPDGNVEFLGRVDRQVKICGFRIELEEIEIALKRHPGIREAIAVAKDVSTTEKQLVAFVVPNSKGATDVSQLRARLSEVLPGYMVPTLILSLEALPLTANGKVDRAALIDKIGSRSVRTPSVSKPESGNERKIAEILEEVLGNGPVGANDNFFDIGANSLQLARFHSRLQIAFDPDMKIISLFQNPTVSSLARSIGANDSSDARTPELRGRAARQRDSYAQRRQMRNGGI